jgi:hypothetical protein
MNHFRNVEGVKQNLLNLKLISIDNLIPPESFEDFEDIVTHKSISNSPVYCHGFNGWRFKVQIIFLTQF